MTPPTTIYLDRDKSSRTNTSNCPSRVRLTKNKNYLPPSARGDKSRAFRRRSNDSDRSIAIDNRKISEKMSTPRIFSRIRRETYTRFEAECTYIFIIMPRSILSSHNFTVTLVSGPGSMYVAGPEAGS